MNDRPDLRGFIEYVNTNPNLEPVVNFGARATIADTPPKRVYANPSGEVILYPDFLIFLTEEKTKPGASLLLKNYLREVGVGAASESQGAVLVAIAAVVVGKFRRVDVLERALSSPNSVFVTLRDIVSVQAGRQLLTQPYITISDRDRKLQLLQDYMNEGLLTQAKGLIGGWQSSFVNTLRGMIGQ